MIQKPPTRFHSRGTLACAMVLLGLCGPASAEADGAHVVQPGDTLYELARRYLSDPTQWRRLQSLNGVDDPLRLMPGRTLVIPARLRRLPTAPAQVLHVAGPASMRTGSASAPRTLSAGQRIEEGGLVEVGDGGFVSLRLADGSEVRVSTGSTLRLRELRHQPSSGRARSVLELQRGRVDATVKPLPPASGNRFEVRTPLAVGGVRGTTFGVAVSDNGDFIGDVREGAIQVKALAAAYGQAATLVRAGEGARVGAGRSASVQVASLLSAPDLSLLPAVVEDPAWIDLRLPDQPGAFAWRVELASGEDGQRVVRNASFSGPLARFAGLEDGDYRLMVRAVNNQGMPGQEAVRALRVNAQPQAPLRLAPGKDSRVPAPGVELRCTEGAGAGALSYRFEVARDPDFGQPVARSGDVATCRFHVGALPPGRYFWRVASVARDARGLRDQGPFSQATAFAAVPLPPVPEALNAMAQASTLNVHWGESPGGPWRHQIQIASDIGFTELLEDRVLPRPAHTRPLPPPGVYFLRVRQLDAEGLQGNWSSLQRLQVEPEVTTSDQRALTSSDGRAVTSGAR